MTFARQVAYFGTNAPVVLQPLKVTPSIVHSIRLAPLRSALSNLVLRAVPL